jgi:predicted dehydrogenase
MATEDERRIRYAVVGLGNIAQVAVLPAFENAKTNSELVALVSSDAEKLAAMKEKWGVEHGGSYDDLEKVLRAARADAVYIALPNSLHREFTERAARQGMHVLCEKPMAMTPEDCQAMIDACEENDVELMIAYRLHFEEANLKAIEIAQRGDLGELRYFDSSFSHDVRPGDIRTRGDVGGGALYDLGLYCVNAARYLFRDEPEDVFAAELRGTDERFEDVDASTVATLRFPGGRLAQFTCSQAAASVDTYRLVGTKGDLRVEPAYTYYEAIEHFLTIDGKTSKDSFPKRDQFGPELVHFSRCILDGDEPEPSGYEGLADVRVLAAIASSAQSGQRVKLGPFARTRRPDLAEEISKPAVKKQKTVRAPSPSR